MTSLNAKLPTILSTKRLVLERFDCSKEHYNALLSAMNSETAHRNMGDMGVYTIEDFDKLNHATRVQPSIFPDPVDVDRDIYYILRLKDDGSRIGGISLAQRSPRIAPDMGWAILENYQRQGFAPEACSEFLRFLQHGLGIKEIIAWPGVKNYPSVQVAKKIGLVEGPTLKDSTIGTHSVVYMLPGMHVDPHTSISVFGE